MPEEFTEREISRSRDVRAIATGVSLFRLALGAVCAAETMLDVTGPMAIASNAAVAISDEEGKLVKIWGQAYPTGEINDARSLLEEAGKVFRGEEPLKESLLKINGPWVDERIDKWTQNMRTAALATKAVVRPTHLVLPMLRNVPVSDGRELYKSLGVEGVESAAVLGQIKTTLLELAFMTAASKRGRQHKKLTSLLFVGGTVLSLYSGAKYMHDFEKAYLEKTGELDGGHTPLKLVTMGLHRTLQFGFEKRKIKWQSRTSQAYTTQAPSSKAR